MKSMKKYKKGGKKFPDLNNDGKVTFADVLKGRGVEKAMKGMKYDNGGKLKKLKKKGPSTDRIKNNKANLEAKKLMASSMKGSANVGKNPYEGRAAGAQRRGPKDLMPMGPYTPQPKPAPKPMKKKKGYRRVWDADAGRYIVKLNTK